MKIFESCKSALEKGGFDVCIAFNETSLDEEFVDRNEQLMKAATGAGYWVWKPYIVLKTIFAMNDDDVMFYNDVTGIFIKSMDPGHFCIMDEQDMDIGLFQVTSKIEIEIFKFFKLFKDHNVNCEEKYSKADAWILMGMDRKNKKISQTGQLLSGFILARKTFRAIQFFSMWYTYNQDERIVSNKKSHFEHESDLFVGNRNDQTVLSLLRHRCGIQPFPDLSQWGERLLGAELRKQKQYQRISQTFINLTRNKS